MKHFYLFENIYSKINFSKIFYFVLRIMATAWPNSCSLVRRKKKTLAVLHAGGAGAEAGARAGGRQVGSASSAPIPGAAMGTSRSTPAAARVLSGAP